mgnify:CR=1 FL=1
MEKNSMEQTNTENRLLQLLLETGERLMASGAEVKRVEDTLERIGVAYGAERMNVFVITSSIVNHSGKKRRNSFDSHKTDYKISTDFLALERINALSRECCREPLPLDLFEQRLRECVPPKKQWQMYLGSVLAAGSFAVFFGGSFADGLAAAVFAVIICLFQEKGAQLLANNVMFNLVCSFFTGTLICLTVKFLPFFHADKIMIGDIMLLIPGIAITNSIRDMLMGDTIAGIMRLIESILWAGALPVALWLLYGWWEYERSDFAACYGVYGISGIFHDLPASKKPLDGRFSWWSLCWGCYLLMFDVTQHIFASALWHLLLRQFTQRYLRGKKWRQRFCL